MMMSIYNALSHLFSGMMQDTDLVATGLSFNSKHVKPGHIFCNPRSARFGLNYLDEAIAKGALVVPRSFAGCEVNTW